MKLLRFLTVLLLLCCMPFSAFAMDMGFISNAYNWTSNADAVYVPIDSERFGGHLKEGFYQYYFDLSDNCFYLRLSYEEDNLESDNEVYLQFNIRNDSHEYRLLVDENGLINLNDYAPKTFEIVPNFGEASEQGQDIYLGIGFLNKEDQMLNTNVSFSIVVNKTEYELCDGNEIVLRFGDYAASQTTTKPTTTKPSTTKQSTTKETTTKQTTNTSTTEETVTDQTTTKKETTTKFKYTATTTNQTTAGQATADRVDSAQTGTGINQTSTKETTTTSEKTTKPKTENTTKFKYTETGASDPSGKYPDGVTEGNNITGRNENTEENTTAAIGQAEAVETENGIIIPETGSMAAISPQAKLLTAAAVIFAVAGTAIIARNLLLKKKDETDEEE